MNNKLWSYATPGIPDELFSRGKIPMTKEEIRVVTLAKARLAPEQIIWDIGAGTGSLSIEAARLTKDGVVYAVERNPAGLELIRENKRRFAADNLILVAGEAPAALAELPAPHRVFIGGSGGQLEEILNYVTNRITPDGRIVINAVTLETAARFAAPPAGWQCEIVQLQTARAVPTGRVHLWRALNPVCVITLERRR
ncbi:MAG: precorrin-6Y C5,15-methyltransferase (decarboxylating) subunit CbiT [Firmicutes bacterium]|nr:precorrin-6Y C5,15-methyltransferase (decarboxylating) subunit CbiT [Bacillota bacterium]